ncbi:MAG: hypothetical protein P8L85_00715 [Rubripirellula sp.]|nr:hypothetical protein [Rubripirellula sp.]
MEIQLSPELAISGVSLALTSYFWLVRIRKERPNLEFVQLSDFQFSCRRDPERENVKRVCLQQREVGGVLIVNHSLRQNSIISFECYLDTPANLVQGEWGYTSDDKPPWNVGPETSIAFSPACFFDVPADFVEPENPVFYLRFRTASGRKFVKRFTKLQSSVRSEDDPILIQQAA